MKKGYYIVFGSQGSSGVNKKIRMQMEEMKKNFKIELIEVPKLARSFSKRILGLLPWISNNYDYNDLFERLENPDFIYIRAILCDSKYVKFLKRVKDELPNCKIAIEYPTYPYDKEHMRLGEIFFLFKDMLVRKYLYKYVDKAITFSQDESIWKIPTIRTINGIDVDSVKKIQPVEHEDDEIHLIAVAMFQEYHGYERLISGISDYYAQCPENKKKVVLHMVGEGTEKKKYVQLVNKLGLENYVLFYGSKQGDELDELYNKADLAVASLGLYKLNINWLSALKTREYLAKGLPMITGCRVDILTEQFPYFLEYENNGTIISVNKIVEFYNEIYGTENDRKEIIENIRQFAKDTVDMNVVMKPIIDFLVSEE